MATAKRCKTKRARCEGFTMIELLIAFGLMVVLMSTVYIIFDTGSKVFGKSAARLEIMEMARTVFHIMERDLNGATLDSDGRVFVGYGCASRAENIFAGRKIFGLPALHDDWRKTCYYLWQSAAYNVSYNFSDLVWFRTDTAPEAKGGQAEVIYRLAKTGGNNLMMYYYGGTLERGVRTSWPASLGETDDPEGPYLKVINNRTDAIDCPPITSSPSPSYVSDNTGMQVIPLAPFCYELRFDYLDSISWNVQSGNMQRMHDGVTVPDYGWWMAAREVWPPRGAWPGLARGPLSENRLWSPPNFTAPECRRHLPAAVKAYVRIGDANQAVWADMQLDFGSWQREKDDQVQVDEVGMVFEQWFFLQNHVRFPYPD